MCEQERKINSCSVSGTVSPISWVRQTRIMLWLTKGAGNTNLALVFSGLNSLDMILNLLFIIIIIHAFTALWKMKFEQMVVVLKFVKRWRKMLFRCIKSNFESCLANNHSNIYSSTKSFKNLWISLKSTFNNPWFHDYFCLTKIENVITVIVFK